MLNIGCVEGKQRGEGEWQECKGRLEVVFGRFEIQNSQIANAGGGVGDGVQESGLKTQIGLVPFPPKAAKLHITDAFKANFLHFSLVVLISIGPFSSFQKIAKFSKIPIFSKFFIFFQKMPFFSQKNSQNSQFSQFSQFLKILEILKKCFWLQKGAFFENFEKNIFLKILNFLIFLNFLNF